MKHEFHFRKVTDPADSRMRTRTAKEQHAQAMLEANRDQDASTPDADDESATRSGVLS